MVKWIRKRNIQYWALSFLIAVALWIYVAVMLDPEIENTVWNIPVVYTDEDILENAELALMSYQDAINVTFEGKRTDLNALSAKTLSAVVSLTDVKQNGESKLFFELEGPRELNSVRVLQIPAYITVTADNLLTKEVPVVLNLNVSPAENYTLEPEQVSPAFITLRGPESLLAGIKEARAEYSQTEPLSQSYEKSLEYTLYDPEGRAVKRDAAIVADTERILLSQRVPMMKELPFRLGTNDGGGLTRENLEFDFEPKSVIVTGDASLLEGMNALTIGTLELSGLWDDKTIDYPGISALLPDGVRNASGVESVRAGVRIVGAPKRELQIPWENFELSNSRVPEGYMIKFTTTQLTVTIRGPEALVGAVEQHNISVMVDMPEGELSPQTYTRNARVRVNGHAEVGVPDYEYTVVVAVVPVPAQETENIVS